MYVDRAQAKCLFAATLCRWRKRGVACNSAHSTGRFVAFSLLSFHRIHRSIEFLHIERAVSVGIVFIENSRKA